MPDDGGHAVCHAGHLGIERCTGFFRECASTVRVSISPAREIDRRRSLVNLLPIECSIMQRRAISGRAGKLVESFFYSASCTAQPEKRSSDLRIESCSQRSSPARSATAARHASGVSLARRGPHQCGGRSSSLRPSGDLRRGEGGVSIISKTSSSERFEDDLMVPEERHKKAWLSNRKLRIRAASGAHPSRISAANDTRHIIIEFGPGLTKQGNHCMTAYRSIDGTGNNQNFNATSTDMTRVGVAHFADGVSEPIETVNPRTVSNNVVGQGDANVANPEGFSAFMYSWGQFIDHDLDRVDSDGINHIDITVPPGDPLLSGLIPMTRSIVDPTNQSAINQITGWLDASMVYGSDQTTLPTVCGWPTAT